MSSRAITLFLLALIGIPLLLLLGQWSATDPILAGISGGVVIGAVIILNLGARCWVLIPFFSTWTGALTLVPGQFAPRDLIVGLVVPLMLVIWVVRRYPLRFRFGWMEFSLVILVVFLLQAFVRNPAGLQILGSEMVGGRPYFELAISLVAFVVMAMLVVDFKTVRLMVWAMIVGSIMSGLYEAMVGFLPAGLALQAAYVYRGETVGNTALDAMDGADPHATTGRMIFLKLLPEPIMRAMLAFRSPLRLLAPKFILPLMIAAACVLLSGFRSVVVVVGMMGIAAAILHRRTIELVIVSLLGLPILVLILIGQGRMFDLPLPAQRALSFLPADWDRIAVVEGEGSLEWRMEMWKEALGSDRYIRNKWLGDGYGYTVDELSHQLEMRIYGVRSKDVQEYYLAVGSFHSGPVETIKRIGYLGLAVLILVMIAAAARSVRLVRRTRGTPYGPYAMFVALPTVVLPFYFILVFGAFQQAVTQLLIAAAVIRIIEHSAARSLAAVRAPRPAAAPALRGVTGTTLRPGGVVGPA